MDERKSTSPACSACGPWWRLPLLLALVLAAVWLARGGVRESRFQSSDAPRPGTSPLQAEADPGRTVSLEIDAGEGEPRQFQPVAWRPGMTVYDLLRESPRSDALLNVRGEGETAFLTNLDGVANEGSGGRNWIYKVNSRHADRSFAVYELQPGDHVLWSFAAAQ